eukprot:1194837-Prorocentrum_minimum.AAC.4
MCRRARAPRGHRPAPVVPRHGGAVPVNCVHPPRGVRVPRGEGPVDDHGVHHGGLRVEKPVVNKSAVGVIVSRCAEVGAGGHARRREPCRGAGIFSRRTNQMQEARAYSHDGPIEYGGKMQNVILNNYHDRGPR